MNNRLNVKNRILCNEEIKTKKEGKIRMRNLFYCKDEKIYQYVYIILIILSFIPLFIISFYAHPSADDYSYSIETYRLWSETNNIVVLLKAAYNETVSSWNTWQGLYSSAFLLSLQPAIYGESWYCLTGIIMLSLLIGGNNKYDKS